MHLRELDTNLIVVLDALLIDASVTKAAERLGRSPSAISHALANMREIFGDPLFVRAGQRLVPTARAEELAPTVHIIVSGIENLLRPAAPFDPGTQERTFVFACSEDFELTLLRRLRAAIRNAAPGISIFRKPLEDDTSLEDLRHGRAQFLIVHEEPREDAADFIWQTLIEEPFVTVARANHPLARSEPSMEVFAAQQHLVTLMREGGPDPVLAHFEQHGVEPGDAVTASSLFVALFLALDSEALATVPASVADAFATHQKLAIVRQPFPPLAVPVTLGWHRSRDRDECHEWLRARIVEVAGTA